MSMLSSVTHVFAPCRGYGDNTSLTDECQDIANNCLRQQGVQSAEGDLLPILSQPPKGNEYGGCDKIGNKSWGTLARPDVSALG